MVENLFTQTHCMVWNMKIIKLHYINKLSNKVFTKKPRAEKAYPYRILLSSKASLTYNFFKLYARKLCPKHSPNIIYCPVLILRVAMLSLSNFSTKFSLGICLFSKIDKFFIPWHRHRNVLFPSFSPQQKVKTIERNFFP